MQIVDGLFSKSFEPLCNLHSQLLREMRAAVRPPSLFEAASGNPLRTIRLVQAAEALRGTVARPAYQLAAAVAQQIDEYARGWAASAQDYTGNVAAALQLLQVAAPRRRSARRWWLERRGCRLSEKRTLGSMSC